MLSDPSTRNRISDERGFMLIELLVAMVAGLVVLGALFSILDVSLHETSRLTDKAQVDQTGRTTMNAILDELHSSCISYAFVPVWTGSKGSTPSKLVFTNAYSKEAVIASAIKQEIFLNEKEELIDKSYPSNGGSWPSFTFSETASPAAGVRIASNVSKVNAGTPIFRYYAYSTTSEGTSTTPYGAIKTTPITEAELTAGTESIASVQVTYNQAPSDGYPASTGIDRNATFNAQTTLAFSVPKSEVPIHDAPCQ